MSEQTEPLPLSVIAQDHAAIKPTASSSTDTGDHSPPHDNKKPCVPTKNRKLKNIMTKSKNEVSFEEPVSLLGENDFKPKGAITVSPCKEQLQKLVPQYSCESSNDTTSAISTSDEASANYRSQHSHSSSKNTNRNRKTTYQRPPDGGWGWVVVFASFMINLISDGISLSIGVIFVELDSYFNQSKSKTAWIGSLFLSFPLITGPIASALTDHFGCRKMAIVGSVLTAFGFLLGYYSTSIEHLYVAFSISGCGLALCYVTSIVSVAYYFEKRRSLATGLAVCGSGVGTLMFAPLIEFLLNLYNWQGTLLILSAIFLNIICFGLLIRDLNIDTSASDVSDNSTSDIESNLIDSDLDSLDSKYNSNENCGQTDLQSHLPVDKPCVNGKLTNPRIRHISECDPSNETMPVSSVSLINIPTYIKNVNNDNGQSKQCETVFNELTFRNGGYLHNLICYYPHLLSIFLPWNIDSNDLTVKTVANCPVNSDVKAKTVDFVDTATLQIEDQNKTNDENQLESKNIGKKAGQLLNLRPTIRTVTMNHQHHHHHPNLANNMYLTPSGNCLHNLRLQRGSLTYRSAMLVINKYKLKASSAPDIYRTSMATINDSKGVTFFHNLKEILYNMIDISNFKSFRFSIFCLSNFVLYACIDVPYVCLPDQVITSGAFAKEGASYLISILGVSNTLGVVFVGYIGDKQWFDTSFIYALFISLNGLSLAAIPLTTNRIIIITLASIYGFTISANYSLVSVILVDIISLDSFTNAYGMLLLVQGIGSLIGPPLAGWLFDIYGSYDEAFYITGICSLVSGVLVLPVGCKNYCLHWFRKRKSANTTDMLPIAKSTAFSALNCCKSSKLVETVADKPMQHMPLTQKICDINEVDQRA